MKFNSRIQEMGWTKQHTYRTCGRVGGEKVMVKAQHSSRRPQSHAAAPIERPFICSSHLDLGTALPALDYDESAEKPVKTQIALNGDGDFMMVMRGREG